MKILVIGGRGYIGSVLSLRLLEEGHIVYVIDDKSYGDREVVGVKYIDEDVVKVREFFDIDVVYHLAALVDINKCFLNPAEAVYRNVLTTVVAVDIALKNKAKFIYASTGGVYSESLKPLKEEDLIKPKNFYSETKLIGEFVVNYALRLGLKALIFRFFCVVGGYRGLGEYPGQGDHILPKLVDAAVNGKEFTIYGDDYPTEDGTTVRDYVHVLDIVDGLIKGIRYLDEENFGVFNLGTGVGISVKQLIREVEDVLGKKVDVKVGSRRVGDPVSLVCDYQLAKRKLGWYPQRSIKQAIVDLL